MLAEQALAQARRGGPRHGGRPHRGPLHGVPISLKDILDLAGIPTTAASRVRDGHARSDDAVVVARLRDAGAVFVGKTNLHEFALGTTNEDSAFGPVRHPLDPNRSPGGSSGGSAASVLDGMAYASIGTDTGGSIRIPAAACGLVGLKPALGEIPTDGIVPLSATMDHVGPLCRSVEDAGDPVRHAAWRAGREPAGAGACAGYAIGVLRGYFTAVLDPQVASAFDRRARRWSRRARCSRTSTSRMRSDIAAIYLHIVLAEAAAYHAKTLESRADDYTPNVRLRLEMGRYILAEDYVRALRGREVLRARWMPRWPAAMRCCCRRWPCRRRSSARPP